MKRTDRIRNKIVFILLCLPTVGFAQCDDFTVIPTSLSYDLQCYDNENVEQCSDLSYHYMIEMVNMLSLDKIDSLEYYFKKLVFEVDRKVEINENSLKIIFKYGRIMELIGQHDKASYYFKYVKEHPNSSDFVEMIADIGLGGEEDANQISKKVIDGFDEELASFNSNEKFLILSYLGSKANALYRYRLADISFSLLDSSSTNSESKIFMEFLDATLRFAGDERYSEIPQLQENHEIDEDLCKETVLFYLQKAREQKELKNYEEMLRLVQKAVELEFGKFKDANDLIDQYYTSTRVFNVSFEHYANALLFYSRIALDTTPVVNAFAMHKAIYTRELGRKYSTIAELVGGRADAFESTHENILIIGNYLHGKNGEMSYLNESVQIMDGFIGAGAVFLSKVREQMRFDPGFKQELEQLHQRGEDLRNATQDISLTELNQRVQDLWKAEDEFKSRYPELFSGEFEEVKIDLEEISREMARDSSAVVSFYGNDLILYRLFVSGDSIEVKILNGYRAEVEQLSADLPKLLANPKASARADTLGHRLYAMLLGDIDSILPPRLHVITSGSLSDVSFAGLRTSPPGTSAEYLGTRQALSRQFSIGSMLALRNLELSPRYARPLALAPSFGDDFIAAGELRQAGFVLPPLLYNKEELDNLQEQSAGKYLYDDRATLEEYREFAPDYGIIHLASHAISSKMNGVLSRVFLLDEKGDPIPLYAGDIGQETLNAELVVLSACETGGGGLHEIEGLVGLTRAYLAAGARSVVSSSWAVDDRATSELMETFYAATAAGQAPHDALRTARRAYRQLHPDAPVANWAAFEAYGGMQPVNWQREGGHLPWGWIGGGFVALLGGGLLLRRRAA